MEGPCIRVQIAPGKVPRYVSVVLDLRGTTRRKRIVTLHSFGRDSLMARVRADRFRADCLLAYQYLRQAIEDTDRNMVAALFATTLGTKTLGLLAPGTVAPDIKQAERTDRAPSLPHIARKVDIPKA
jgi:hypothetical protein